MKKFSVLVILLAILLLFTNCDYLAGSISIKNTQFVNKLGAGTRSYLLVIPKDGSPVPLSDPPRFVEGRDEYLPNGIQGIVDKLQAECKLEDARIFWVDFENPEYQKYEIMFYERDQIDVVVLQFDYNNIDELNEKTRILADGEPIGDAEIKINKYRRVLYTEPGYNFRNATKWVWDAILNDPEVFNSDHDPDLNTDMLTFMLDSKIDFGGGGVSGGVDKDVSIRSFIWDAPPEELFE